MRARVLDVLCDELYTRVGTALSNGVGEAELVEFSRIVEGDAEAMVDWIARYRPDYYDDPLFREVCGDATAETSLADVLSTYASMVWIRVRRPDFREVVARAAEGLYRELREDPVPFLLRVL